MHVGSTRRRLIVLSLVIISALYLHAVPSTVFASVLGYIEETENTNAHEYLALITTNATTRSTQNRTDAKPNPTAITDTVDGGVVVTMQFPAENDTEGQLGPPISYQLVRGRRYILPQNNTVLRVGYKCRNTSSWDVLDNRMELPASNPFDFNTFVQTSLNILIMGDSLAVQFGNWFQAAGEGATNKRVLKSLTWSNGNTTVDGLAVAKVKGGGSIAFWRILGLWENRLKARPLPNSGRGWRTRWVRVLRNKIRGGEYNVVIYRISHPWLSPEEVTEAGLNETIQVAKECLGQSLIVIFQTAPFNNNILTSQDLINFRAMNSLVRSFVTNLNQSDVLLSDVETYMENVIEWNAKQLGMDTINSTSDMLEHLAIPHGSSSPTHHTHIAQVCSERVPPSNIKCRLNMLSNDGLHPCMETLGPRMFANSACLIQCAYRTTQSIRQCERGCNEKYFRLNIPIQGIQFAKETDS